ncbi:hypothetical protein PR001_g31808 [Phytophthora rubi]|uniref:Uncharacterized protein n=1 Tax=Phytophthora rubi TaxID=129364 RepID=A0A6A3GQG1_9STRA|nr:hypothetical protein PR001_g31808 [Phytophthora rubi]
MPTAACPSSHGSLRSVCPLLVLCKYSSEFWRKLQSGGERRRCLCSANLAPTHSITPIALSVQRARQIRKTDFERFQKFYNYNLFVSNDDVMNAKVNTKHDQVGKLP